MEIFAVIAERRISEAMARGEFDNLPGVPAELRMAYRLLKNAGFVPPEVELRREIVSLRMLIDTLEDEAELRRRGRELQAKMTKLSILLRRPVHLGDAELWQSPLTPATGTRIIHLPD